MKTVDVQDELAEGFEPSPLPPIRPDGSLELSPLLPDAPKHPRLCEAGPCAHYHRFEIQLDAQQPLPEKQPDGTFKSPPAVFHPEVHHYCYPTQGVEMKLGGLPVLKCNRWAPMSEHARQIEINTHRDFWATAAGHAYRAELAAFEALRANEAARAAAEAQQADADLAAQRALEAQAAPYIVVINRNDGARARITVKWTDTVHEVVERAGFWAPGTPFNIFSWNNHRISNTATVAQAGLASGDPIGVSVEIKETP